MLLNRNLIQLARSVCAARLIRIDTIKPTYLRSRFFSNKSSVPCDNSSPCKSTCPEEPQECESKCEGEAPTSRYPSICCDEVKSASPQCGTAPMCPPPKPTKSCAPMCDEKPPCPKPRGYLLEILTLLALIVAIAAAVHLYQENLKLQEQAEPAEPTEPAEPPTPPDETKK